MLFQMPRISPIVIMAAASFLTTTTIQLVTPIISVFAFTNLSATLDDVAIVISVGYVASFSSKLAAGALLRSDWPLRALMAALIGGTVVQYALALVPNVSSLIVVRGLVGIASGVLQVALLTAAASVARSESEMVTSVGLYATGNAMGFVLGPALGTLLVAAVGVRAALFGAALVLTPSIALGYAFVRTTKQIRAERAGAGRQQPSSALSLREMAALLRSRELLVPYLVFFAFAYGVGIVYSYVPIEASVAYGMSDAQITGLFLGYFVVALTLRVLMKRLLNRFGYGRVLFVGLAFPALGIFMTGAGLGPVVFSVGFVLAGFGHGIVFPLTAILIAKAFPINKRTKVNSVYLTAFDLGVIVSPLVASQLEIFVGLGWSMALSAVVPFMGLFLIPSLRTEAATDGAPAGVEGQTAGGSRPTESPQRASAGGPCLVPSAAARP